MYIVSALRPLGLHRFISIQPVILCCLALLWAVSSAMGKETSADTSENEGLLRTGWNGSMDQMSSLQHGTNLLSAARRHLGAPSPRERPAKGEWQS